MEKIYHLKDIRSIPIDIPAGYFVLAEVTTLASYKVNISIITGNQVIWSVSRQSMNPLPVYSSFFQCSNSELQVEIDIQQSNRIDARVKTNDFKNQKGEIVVKSIIIICEDAEDEDYNDVIINLTVMKNGY